LNSEALLAVVASRISEFVHEGVPVLSGGELHENNHGIGEGLEVIFRVQAILEHDPAEEVGAEGCIDEEEQQDQ